MRVGMILDKAFPPDPRVENEALALVEKGHEVFLFCLNYKEQISKEIYQGIQLRRSYCSNFVYKLSALAYTIPWYTNIMAKKISSFIEENAIDALHIHDMRIAEAALKANETFRLPSILDLHENLPEIMKSYRHVQRFPGKLLIYPHKWKRKEEEFIRKVNKVVVVTEESKHEISERVGVDSGKILAVPNTVRSTFYENAPLNSAIITQFQSAFVLLYIGDTGLRRGLATAIEAVSLVKDDIPELQLVIVGKGSADHILKDQVRKFNVQDIVKFEGWKDPHLFASYISASHIGISPLHRNKHHDTTFANKLFQYMAFSTPVLVSDATAQKNLIESTGTGLVHKEKDAQDFAEKVRILYRDPITARQMGGLGKQVIISKYNWKINTQKLGELYDELSI